MGHKGFDGTEELSTSLHIYRLLYCTLCFYMGFPGGSVVKNWTAMQQPQETWVRFLGWEDPLEEGMASHSSILVWRIPMVTGTWRATRVHRVIKNCTLLK